jgi:hypothetical protein
LLDGYYRRERPRINSVFMPIDRTVQIIEITESIPDKIGLTLPITRHREPLLHNR